MNHKLCQLIERHERDGMVTLRGAKGGVGKLSIVDDVRKEGYLSEARRS